MKLRHFITLVLLTVIYTSLDNTVIHAETLPDYYPLSVGNTWISKHTPLGSNTGTPRMSTMIVDGTEDDGLIRTKSSTDENEDRATYGWYKKDDNGDIFYCKVSTSPDPDMAIAEWNPPIFVIDASELKKGGRWEYKEEMARVVGADSTVAITVTNTSVVDSVNETVTVPAGSFTNCLKVRFTAVTTLGDTVRVSTSFYAPGVGGVLFAHDYPEDQKSRIELIDFMIK